MIDKLNCSKGKIKMKFCRIFNIYYEEMNYKRQGNAFQFKEDHFSKNAEGFPRICHEVVLLLKFLQNKPRVKNSNNKYYDFYYTVIKIIDEKGIVNDENGNIEKKFNIYEVFIISIHQTEIKSRETIIR